MYKFIFGIVLGLLGGQAATHWLKQAPAFAQNASDKKTPAKVLSSGVLLDWRAFVYLVRNGDPQLALSCDAPQISIKYKTIICSTEDEPISRGPLIVGRAGSLRQWKIEVSGEPSFDCNEPTVNFLKATLECPVQPELAAVRLLLTQTQAKLDRIQAQARQPEPWTINTAVPPHGFACPAGVIDIEARIVTCPSVLPLF